MEDTRIYIPPNDSDYTGCSAVVSSTTGDVLVEEPEVDIAAHLEFYELERW